MSRFSGIGALALAALLLAAPTFAADVSLYQGSSSLSFQPEVSAAGATLIVTGPNDFLSHQDFASAANVSFELSNDMADGIYTYELVLHPKVGSALRQEMNQARAEDDTFIADVIAAELAIEPVSGSFTVKNGAIINGELAEQAASISQTGSGLEATSGAATFDNVSAAAQVFTTDVIVQGSECVGFDCTTSENFGADTLRLKENNLRVHFNDTSSSGSFPNNDWRITINDSTNGGANYFSIDDATAGRTPFRIEAGSIANALYIDSDGDVGIGTNNPVVEVHAVDGNTPTYRLEQNGSSGFQSQTWDIAGNETNFFVRDVTNGSKLPFRIEPNSPTNALYVDSTGNIGVGTNTPADELTISTSDRPSIRLIDTDDSLEWEIRRSGSGFAVVNNDDTNEQNFVLFDDGNVRMGNSDDSANPMFLLDPSGNLTLGGAANATAFNTTSDRNQKENFSDIDTNEILQKVVALPMTRWNFIQDGKKVQHVGPMAQDFRAAFGLGVDDRHIATVDADGVAFAAIQALYQQLEAKNAQLEAVTQRLEALEAKIAQ